MAPRGGQFELRDELTGAVPQGHLPDKKKCAEDRGDECIAAMQGGGIAHQIELHHPVPKIWITISNPFREGDSSEYLHIEKV